MPKLPVEILTRSEAGTLLRTCNRRSPSGLRDRALIALLYGSGLRLAEALALRPRDLDLDETILGLQVRPVEVDAKAELATRTPRILRREVIRDFILRVPVQNTAATPRPCLG